MPMTALASAVAAIGLALLPLKSSADTTLVADWEMNESASTTVMQDSSGNNLDGQVNPTGVSSNGSYYHWVTRCPTCEPVAPERVISVPENDQFDIVDPNVTWTAGFRFRTTSTFSGNIMQKGQSTAVGGQIKIQAPRGRMQCLFKGANGVRVGSGSSVLVNDGEWHNVQCIHTATRVTTWVDGVRTGVKNGSTGPINNSKPFTIGGKTICDQVTITCDYFSGDIDYIRITRG